jgi:hypothetical protein
LRWRAPLRWRSVRRRCHDHEVGTGRAPAGYAPPTLPHPHNAGIGGEHATTDDYPLESWRSVLSVNLDGVFYSTRAEIGAMRTGGVGRS